MDLIQNLIHRLEVGGGSRVIKLVAGVLLLLLLGILYFMRGPSGFETREAMETAQLARNLAEGKGYTTSVITPFSMHLVARQSLSNEVARVGEVVSDRYRIRGPHPDLAHPPVYPLLLAGVMKVLPFRYEPATLQSLFRYQPDVLIGLVNQVLFGGVILLSYLLARRLFEPKVALLTTVILLGTELLWRFTTSGLSTILLLLIFLALAWCMVLIEEELRERTRGPAAVFLFSALAGLVVGVGGMTRYSFGVLILPVVAFLAIYGGRKRIVLSALALVAFGLVFAPWTVRNYQLTDGAPFGTRGYTALTFEEPAREMERKPGWPPLPVQRQAMGVVSKLKNNVPLVLKENLPRLGGNWVTVFFLVGLLVSYGPTSATRMRYFLLLCLAALVGAQAVLMVQHPQRPPEANAEDLLIILAPMVFAFGISLFYALLDMIELPFRELRFTIVGALIALTCLPMLLLLIQRAFSPPAYFGVYETRPEMVIGSDGLVVTDVPWATAWYGQRDSVLLPTKASPGFFWLYSERPPAALFLSSKFLEDLSNGKLAQAAAFNENWESLAFGPLQALSENRLVLEEWLTSWPKQLRVGLRFENQWFMFNLDTWQKGWPVSLLLTGREAMPHQRKLLLEGFGPVNNTYTEYLQRNRRIIMLRGAGSRF